MAFDPQEFLGLSGTHIPEPGVNGARGVCFASGSNRIPEVRGFCRAGIPIGLAADQLVSSKGELAESVPEIERLAGTGLPVFLDSGAYGEFKSFQGPKPRKDGTLPRAKKPRPITDQVWRERFVLYFRLAKALGPQLYCVAPDKIADQETTFERLRTYAPEVRELASLGAQILLPLQGGELSLEAFQAKALDIIRVPFIPAFPMREGITPIPALIEFVRTTQPAKIHLLGLGAANGKTQALLEDLWAVNPALCILQDSMLLRSRVGTKEEPRRYDEVNSLSEQLFCDDRRSDMTVFGESFQYTDEIGDPTAWMSPAARVETARRARLTAEETERFVADPTEFMESPCAQAGAPSGPWDLTSRWAEPGLDMAIEQAWEEEVRDRTAQARRAWSIPRAFDDHEAAHQFPGVEDLFHLDMDPGPEVDAEGQLAMLEEIRQFEAERRTRWEARRVIPVAAKAQEGHQAPLFAMEQAC